MRNATIIALLCALVSCRKKDEYKCGIAVRKLPIPTASATVTGEDKKAARAAAYLQACNKLPPKESRLCNGTVQIGNPEGIYPADESVKERTTDDKTTYTVTVRLTSNPELTLSEATAPTVEEACKAARLLACKEAGAPGDGDCVAPNEYKEASRSTQKLTATDN
jgi:hypothetical protein